ncbi:hypothetical protein OG851_05090 [Streptomyces sp. NBC_00161]|uniref:hypothetical protein n=1 Tax=Streptomyces sp. NBC_00161 TaxID=2975671 RepID=UPI0032547AC5
MRMTARGQVDMARSQVFGEVAELYDASRPGYADALAADVLGAERPFRAGRYTMLQWFRAQKGTWSIVDPRALRQARGGVRHW